MGTRRWIDVDKKIHLCFGCEISFEESMDLSDEKVLNFMFTHCVLSKSIRCCECKKSVKLKRNIFYNGSNTTGHLDYKTLFYICRQRVDLLQKRTGRCYSKQGLLTKSFLENKKKLPLSKMFQIANSVLWTPSPRKQFLINQFGITHETVNDLCLRFREVFIVSVCKNTKRLGGKGKVIELDEARSERKKDSGKPWSWAYGGIDRSSNQTFLIPVEHNNAATLKKIILAKINPGTTIVTNCLNRYRTGIFHDLSMTYNFKFVVPAISVLANTIKEHWWEVLQMGSTLSFNKAGHYLDHYAEYLFKSKYPDPRRRLHAFFKTAGELYSPKQ